MKLKKYLALILSLCVIGGATASLSACGGDDSSSGSPASTNTESESDTGDETVEVEYTVTVQDENGAGVEGVGLVISQLGEDVDSGATDEDGKFTGTIEAGEYKVSIVSGTLPEGHVADNYALTVNFTEENATATFTVIDNTPDGSARKPYPFIPDDTGAMEITLSAGAETHYILYRTMGRTLVVNSADVEIVYNGETYRAVDGVIEIAMEGSAEDINAGGQILVKNLVAMEKTVKMQLVSELGSLENPITVTDLAEAVEITVEGKETVYLLYTATASGRLSYEVNGGQGAIRLYNENSFVMTGEGESYLDLEDGDVIRIYVTAENAKDGETDEVRFTLTLQEAQNG